MHSLHKAFTALYIWNTFNPGSPVAHFLTSLLSAVSQWYGTYPTHITHSIFVLKEWVSPSPLSFTTPWCRTAQGRITQTGRHVWTRTHCLPLGGQAPNLPRHLSRAQSASLAQSAALPSPTLPPPPSVAYREKQTNKQTKWNFCGEFPSIIKPALIQLSYMYIRLSSSFSVMNPFPYWKLKNISIFILDLVFPPFWKTQFHKLLLFLLYSQLPTIISHFSWPNSFH